MLEVVSLLLVMQVSIHKSALLTNIWNFHSNYSFNRCIVLLPVFLSPCVSDEHCRIDAIMRRGLSLFYFMSRTPLTCADRTWIKIFPAGPPKKSCRHNKHATSHSSLSCHIASSCMSTSKSSPSFSLMCSLSHASSKVSSACSGT